LFVFVGAYLTRVRNFLPGRVSVWEEEERAVCGRPVNFKAAAKIAVMPKPKRQAYAIFQFNS
jgi:hypothetical protein